MNLRSINEYGRINPIWWIKTVLGVDLWEEQRKIVLGVLNHEETAAKSCHGIGKSLVSACILLWFLYCHTPSTVISTAPSDRQVRGILWAEVRKLHSSARIPLGGRLLTQAIEITEKHFALGFTTVSYDPSRFQGWHNTHILAIVDEAAGVSPQIFSEGVSAILSGGQITRLLMIGNPTSVSGEFYQAFKDPNVCKVSVSAFDTPNFTQFGITMLDIREDTWQPKITGELPRSYLIKPSWVANRYRKWGEHNPLFQARVLATFPKQGEDTLIQLDWLEDAKERRECDTDQFEVELGVDVARFGSDESVIAWRKGFRCGIYEGYRGIDTEVFAEKIKEACIHTGAKRIKIDSIGIGAGVFDKLNHDSDLKLMGVQLIECIASASPSGPSKADFVNAKAEWHWHVRELAQNGLLEIDDDGYESDDLDTLEGQLAVLRYEFDSKGKIKITPKQKLKSEGIPSPDRAEAVIMAFAYGQGAGLVVV